MLIRQKIWRCRLLPLFWLCACVCACLCSVKMERIHFNTILKVCHFKDSLSLPHCRRLSHPTHSHAYTHKNNTNNSSSSSFSFLFYLACFGPGQPFSSVIRMFYENECVCKCTKRRRPRKEEALERKSMQNETINGHIKRQHSERARRHLLCTDPESGCKSAQRQQHQ